MTGAALGRAQALRVREPVSKAPILSPELTRAIDTLRERLRETDNPVGAARTLRRVAASAPPPNDGYRQAFRLAAERLLAPFFGRDVRVAKAVVWLSLDAAWERHGNR